MNDLQMYLADPFGSEGLQDAFQDIDVSFDSNSESVEPLSGIDSNSLLALLPQNDDDPIDLEWFFNGGSENNDSTDIGAGKSLIDQNCKD